MVLPPPAPSDAHGAHEPDWIEQLKVILQLADRGVVVLVDNARPERLGELVRGLLPVCPDLEVHCDARRLLGVPKGATVVLEVNAEQAEWLNFERPVVAHRELRLLLFSTSEISATLSRRAVDLFHWISHRVECPEGPWMPAVSEIRRALCGRRRGVLWSGGDFDAAFRAALPGRTVSYVPVTLAYPELVVSLCPHGREWMCLTTIDSEFFARRARWALAEAKRRFRTALIEPKKGLPGFRAAHGCLMPLTQAASVLEASGAMHSGRLAAALDLSPEQIELASTLLRKETTEDEIIGGLAGSTDPYAVIAALARLKGILSDSRECADDPYHTRIRHALSAGGTWDALAKEALEGGDPQVSERWARRWLAGDANRAGPLALVGAALLEQGDLPEAVEASRESTQIHESTSRTDVASYAEAHSVLGRALTEQGHIAEGEEHLRAAFLLARKIFGPDHVNTILATARLSNVLIWRNQFSEAEHLLRKSIANLEASGAKDSVAWIEVNLARGFLLTEQLRLEDAAASLRDALAACDRALMPEHPVRHRVVAMLAQMRLSQAQPQEAETMLRQSIWAAERTMSRKPCLLVLDLGRALFLQGKYDPAMRCMRDALALADATKSLSARAFTLYNISILFNAQGRHAEAAKYVQDAATTWREVVGEDHHLYASSLHRLAQITIAEGRYVEAEAMLRRVIAIEERIHGRRNGSLISMLLWSISDVLLRQERLSEAERVSKRALSIAIKERNFGLEAETLTQQAVIQSRMNRRDAAVTARRALAALARAFPPHTSLKQEASRLLEAIVEKAHRRGDG